jgi:hypothetical protein
MLQEFVESIAKLQSNTQPRPANIERHPFDPSKYVIHQYDGGLLEETLPAIHEDTVYWLNQIAPLVAHRSATNGVWYDPSNNAVIVPYGVHPDTGRGVLHLRFSDEWKSLHLSTVHSQAELLAWLKHTIHQPDAPLVAWAENYRVQSGELIVAVKKSERSSLGRTIEGEVTAEMGPLPTPLVITIPVFDDPVLLVLEKTIAVHVEFDTSSNKFMLRPDARHMRAAANQSVVDICDYLHTQLPETVPLLVGSPQ